MPILTKQIYTINKVKAMDASVEEKIRLLREIKLDPHKPGCYACEAKRRSATRLLNQMIEGEVHDLNKVLQPPNVD